MADWVMNGIPASLRRDALYVSRRAASISVAAWAIANCTDWNSPIGWPNCFLSRV